MNEFENNKDLKCLILKILANKYSCATEIIQILKAEELEFKKNHFYPTLSNLQLKNFLCTNWLQNNSGENVKYYHITKNGFNYIHK